MNLENNVGYQRIIDDKLIVKYIVVIHLDNGEIEKHLSTKELLEDDFIYESLSEVEEVVESILHCNLKIHDCDNDVLKMTIINKYSALVDGHVSHQFDNYYYNKNGILDAPVYVIEFNNKYAVFKHPNIKNYGFILNEN